MHQAFEKMAEYFGSIRVQLVFAQILGKHLSSIDAVAFKFLQKSWVLSKGAKTEDSFEATSNNRACVLNHAAFDKQNRALKARKATYIQKCSAKCLIVFHFKLQQQL